MQACGGSARVLALQKQKDQDETRKPSYWSDCTEWSNGLDAFRSHDPSQKAKAQRVLKPRVRTRMHGPIRDSDNTT